jgi:glucosamine--fructose-6-phosphate aminotransferase (isomerizing)
MCGIFGIVSRKSDLRDSDVQLKTLFKLSEQRGRDSSGLVLGNGSSYHVYRSDMPITKIKNKFNLQLKGSSFVMGHSRLITNGLSDNQPVVRDGVIVIHNGIIVNESEYWKNSNVKRMFEVDTEVLNALAYDHLLSSSNHQELIEKILIQCKGVVSAAIALPSIGKLILISNNGSLYYGLKDEKLFFASELHSLNILGIENILKIVGTGIILDIPQTDNAIEITDFKKDRLNLVPKFNIVKGQDKLLRFDNHSIRRCTKCVLPATMPYIKFDADGVCNYCNNYRPQSKKASIKDLEVLVQPYRRQNGDECIVPFSGGRDSCFSLHLIVKELKLKPITYTYDWGMVTDLGRRNISRMCSSLGVENIVVAADIANKRNNIRKNLSAWLKAPDLGMVSILTAGDKHFFRHVETVKKQTGISLNIWGINPLEVTHFKSGFLGIPPSFESNNVYISNTQKQLYYQYLRFLRMCKSPGYFNTSLFDTLSGEYFRSFHKKTDYFHLFDFYTWNEVEVDSVLINNYDWELATDTSSTWRIGDATAAFYNYIYYTVAGFSEHDTFRSNQIREGMITREQALSLIESENHPRYENIKWYLDALGMDFTSVISIINSIPKIY